MIKADIICDSISPEGNRLTTFVLTYHRFIHSEVMTYRMWSRNASSSRAIPVEKNIKQVDQLNLQPIHWGANQRGMSADLEISLEDQQQAAIIWNEAKNDAVRHAKRLKDLGIHKQVINRILEPFNIITVVVTASDWQNFFEQRCHSAAQPEIRKLAEMMQAEYQSCEPNLLTDGQWHLPFTSQDMGERPAVFQDLIKVAVGRCARVSYSNHNGSSSVSDDMALHDRLLLSKPAHLSPFEHIAQCKAGQYANFNGWQSYRNQLELLNA